MTIDRHTDKIKRFIEVVRIHFYGYHAKIAAVVFLSLTSALIGNLGVLLFFPLFARAFSAEQTAHSSTFIQRAIFWFFEATRLDITVPNIVLLLIVSSTLKMVIYYASSMAKIRLSDQYRVDIIERIFNEHLKVRWRYFLDQKPGYLLNYIINIATANMLFLRKLIDGAAGVLGVFLYVAFAIAVSAKLALMGLAFIAGSQIVRIFFLVKIKRYGQKILDISNDLANTLEQYLFVNKAVQTTGVGDTIRKEIVRQAKARMENSVKMSRIEITFNAVVLYCISLIIAAGIALSMGIFRYPFNEVFVVCVFLTKVMIQIYNLNSISDIAMLFPGVQKVEEVLGDFSIHREPTIDSGREIISFRDKIIFKNVAFSYREEVAASRGEGNVRTLHNINFEIRKYETVVIVGETGAGKTTVIDLFLGLLKPLAGMIYVDGISLAEINQRSWHKLIGYVPQRGPVINDTFYNNIAFYRDIAPASG